MHLLLTVIGGVLIYALMMTIFEEKRKEEEALARRLAEVERKRSGVFLTQREEVLEQPFFDRTIRPLLTKVGTRMRGLLNTGERANQSEQQLQKQLNHAGSTMQASEYMALRLTLILVGTAAGIFLAATSVAPTMNKLLFVLVGALGPFIVMRYTLAAQVTQRTGAIERQLPEVLDLLSVSVEAGLGFEQAIEYIIHQMDGPLIDELAITSKEITMGRSRRSAFLLLGERCGAESVVSFVSALVQAMDMGISMKVLLSSQADAMRLHRRRVVEEKAQKLSTKLLFPLIFFIFPVLFIILLGPALMNILNTL